MKRAQRLLCWVVSSVLALGLAHGQAQAWTKVVDWNAEDLYAAAKVTARSGDIKRFAEALSPDILTLQEVGNAEVLKGMAALLGQNLYSAASDFQYSSEEKRPLQVGVVSKFPITDVVSYVPKSHGKPGMEEITIPGALAGQDCIVYQRGFLRVRIPSRKLMIYVVHMKSSLGDDGINDAGNACKREKMAGGVLEAMARDRALFPGDAVVLAGDFNVGQTDPRKNGRNLAEDCYELDACGARDRYDDTHAILAEGLTGRAPLANLGLGIKEPSHLGRYGGSPIDAIYVDQASAALFAKAQLGDDPLRPKTKKRGKKNAAGKGRPANKAFGSDHRPVWTVYEPGMN